MDEIEILSTGLIKVKIDDKYGVTSLDGTIIFELVADEVTALSYGVFAVKIDGKWGFVNKTGLWLIEPMFKEVDLTNPTFPLVKIEDINQVKDIFYELSSPEERTLPDKWYKLFIEEEGAFQTLRNKITLFNYTL